MTKDVFECIADTNHVIQHVNPSYTRITGVNYEEIVGKKLVDVCPGAKLPEVIDNGKKLLNFRKIKKVYLAGNGAWR